MSSPAFWKSPYCDPPRPARCSVQNGGPTCPPSPPFPPMIRHSPRRKEPLVGKRPLLPQNGLQTMSNNDLAIVILAAGKGTRLKSSVAKVLHRAGGRTLVEHIVRACEPLKARETVVVVAHHAEQVPAVGDPLRTLTVLRLP